MKELELHCKAAAISLSPSEVDVEVKVPAAAQVDATHVLDDAGHAKNELASPEGFASHKTSPCRA